MDNQLIEHARRIVFHDLGVELPAVITTAGSHYKDIKKFQIAPSMCGPVTPVFKSIEVTVSIALANGYCYLRYQYSWEHPVGSNGYNVIRTFDKDGTLLET